MSHGYGVSPRARVAACKKKSQFSNFFLPLFLFFKPFLNFSLEFFDLFIFVCEITNRGMRSPLESTNSYIWWLRQGFYYLFPDVLFHIRCLFNYLKNIKKHLCLALSKTRNKKYVEHIKMFLKINPNYLFLIHKCYEKITMVIWNNKIDELLTILKMPKLSPNSQYVYFFGEFKRIWVFPHFYQLQNIQMYMTIFPSLQKLQKIKTNYINKTTRHAAPSYLVW